MVGIIVPGHDWPVKLAGYATQIDGVWRAVVDICFENMAPQCVQSTDGYPDETAAFEAARVATDTIGIALCGKKPHGLTSIPGGKNAAH